MSENLPTIAETHTPAMQPASLLETVLRLAADPNTDPERFRQCLEIGKELEARAKKAQFNIDFSACQNELPIIKKNGLIEYKPGSGRGAKFAKWDDIHKACMPILRKHGFGCSFSSRLIGGNALEVIITVKHAAGAEEERSFTLPWLDTGGSKSPAQQAASTFSLGERHVFVKYWNILTEDQDDDGSGKGVADFITEEQARKIEDMVEACEQRDKGFTRRFVKWARAEIKIDQIRDLRQGAQLDSVMLKLKEKMTGLAIK